MATLKPNLAEVPDAPIRFPKLASPKLDGIRALTQVNTTLSRSLKPIPNNHIREILAPYPNLDGELIIGPPTSHSVYRDSVSGVMSIQGTPAFTYYVFDILGDPRPFQERLASLRQMLLPNYIQVLEQRLVSSQEELDAYYEYCLGLGYEGVILRNLNALYKHGRSTAKSQDMLKVKPFADSEAVITGVYEAQHNTNEAFTNELGRTDRSTAQDGLVGNGMVGGFYATDVHTGVEFNCAPGMLTHDERIHLWKNQPVGAILKYRHMPYGLMANNKPRFPRFVGWRDPIDMG